MADQELLGARPFGNLPLPYHVRRRAALKYLFAVTVINIVLFGLYATIQLRSDQLRDLPTDFHSLESQSAFMDPGFSRFLPANPIRAFLNGLNKSSIDDRYVLERHLGAGFEGAAELYNDTRSGQPVVIKTFFGKNRNMLPKPLYEYFHRSTNSWPAEIEASILLGGFNDDSSPANISHGYRFEENADYLPVVDYFVTETMPPNSTSAPRWHLVTPLILWGTLEDIARDVVKGNAYTTDDLDLTFRPTFNRLLSAVANLHSRGYCHDDLKPDNIFVLNRSHWLIGDLGNVRQIHHQYHASRAWITNNQWPDCRLNDVRRALKSYLYLLRHASSDRTRFDGAFYEGKHAWSRLYWKFMKHPVYADRLIGMQRNETSGLIPQLSAMDRGPGLPWPSPAHTTAMDKLRAFAVTRELTCTGLHSTLDDWWALGGLRQKFLYEGGYKHY